jgi:hypothetical protein
MMAFGGKYTNNSSQDHPLEMSPPHEVCHRRFGKTLDFIVKGVSIDESTDDKSIDNKAFDNESHSA